jgi:hypothetical protein
MIRTLILDRPIHSLQKKDSMGPVVIQRPPPANTDLQQVLFDIITVSPHPHPPTRSPCIKTKRKPFIAKLFRTAGKGKSEDAGLGLGRVNLVCVATERSLLNHFDTASPSQNKHILQKRKRKELVQCM